MSMEYYCMEARALKSSLHGEISMESSAEAERDFIDDVWCVAAGISGVSAEDFSVDELLDFSNGEFEEIEEEDDEKDAVTKFSQYRSYDDSKSKSTGLSSQSLLTGELFEPVDDFAELEWVSHFVDDSSCSELSLLYPKRAGIRFDPVLKPGLAKKPCFPLQVPSKRRTKRIRKTGRIWSLGSPLLAESPLLSPLCSFESSSKTHTILTTTERFSCFHEPAAKKPKKRKPVQTGGVTQRRCSHCQTQKTPQWRTGPLGSKTLCNACGVRYKSGRLFPEYRPACSPTFSGDVHSNSHRKVLEMRKKKEFTEPEVGLTLTV